MNTIPTTKENLSTRDFEKLVLEWWNETTPNASTKRQIADECNAYSETDVTVSNLSGEVQLYDSQLAQFWDWYKKKN